MTPNYTVYDSTGRAIRHNVPRADAIRLAASVGGSARVSEPSPPPAPVPPMGDYERRLWAGISRELRS